MRPPSTDHVTPQGTVSADRRGAVLAIGSLAIVAAFGYPRLPRAFAAAAQPAEDTLAQFMALSRWLTGRPSLTVELGRRYFDALAAHDADFAGQLAPLNSLHQAHGEQGLQAYCDAVDASGAAYASLPHRIIAAWYTGQVGKLPALASRHDRSSPQQPDAGATVIAYEMALMYTATADVLTIPSYCRDVPGYWAQRARASAA